MNIQGIHPAIMAPVKAESAGGSTGSNGSTGTSASDLQSTFLNLLVTELQNQDPTSPVDPTQMVSQMVSLNQLNELISINQVLSGMASGSATNASSAKASSTSANTVSPQAQSKQTNMAQPDSSMSMQPQIDSARQNATPGFMNLYAGYGSPATTPNYNQTGAR